jgi:hypothetical protein
VAQTPRAKAISAQVTAVRPVSPGLVAVTLDNGQVWEQVETSDGFYVSVEHRVTIARGLFGSYTMTTDSHQTVRVRQVH